MGLNHPKNWTQIKTKWREKNPPNKDGYYTCWICGKPVHMDKVSFDHVAPVAQYPEYAKDLSNIKPSHGFCNEQRSVPQGAQQIYRFGRSRKKRV